MSWRRCRLTPCAPARDRGVPARRELRALDEVWTVERDVRSTARATVTTAAGQVLLLRSDDEELLLRALRRWLQEHARAQLGQRFGTRYHQPQPQAAVPAGRPHAVCVDSRIVSHPPPQSWATLLASGAKPCAGIPHSRARAAPRRVVHTGLGLGKIAATNL